MSEATEAILDIQEALAEYGSDIVLIEIIEGDYDPISGDVLKVEVLTPTKAFLPSKMTSSLLSNSQIVTTSSFDMVFQLYHNGTIDKSWEIEYNNHNYEIVLIDSTVLQNETLIYEIVAKK